MGHSCLIKSHMVDEVEVLEEMVLAVERALAWGAVLACVVVVPSHMLAVRGHLAAVGAGSLTEDINDVGPVRGALPQLEGEVEGFFVALPVVLCGEGLGAEGTLVPARGLVEGGASGRGPRALQG
jgi:hypothetical protein